MLYVAAAAAAEQQRQQNWSKTCIMYELQNKTLQKVVSQETCVLVMSEVAQQSPLGSSNEIRCENVGEFVKEEDEIINKNVSEEEDNWSDSSSSEVCVYG